MTFPSGRLPKTLIFTKDDNHAEKLAMCAKGLAVATSSRKDHLPQRPGRRHARELIAGTAQAATPRGAVTADMIATGTDIKPVNGRTMRSHRKSRNC